MNQAEARVLVVDDDASFRRAIARLFASVGLPVTRFGAGVFTV
jgi:FixJ family two-component response regulator